MLSDQQLNHFSKAEACRSLLRFVRPAYEQLKQRGQKQLGEIGLLDRVEQLREHIYKNLDHANCATIINDFFLLALDTLREHVFFEKLENSVVGFGPLSWLIDWVHKVLLKSFGHLTKHRSVERDCHRLGLACEQRFVSKSAHEDSQDLSVITALLYHAVALIDTFLL